MVKEQQKMMMIEKDIKFINCLELANCLAEEDWKKATGTTPESDLYETVVSPVEGENAETIRLSKIPKAHWATLFFTIRDSYLEIINGFVEKG